MPLKTRAIQPGYSNGLCTNEFVEKVNCGFATQVYAKFLKKKWGVDACVEDEYNKWQIKKMLLDLNLIYDPAMCVECYAEEPCGIVVTGQIFNPQSTCLAPTNVTAETEYPPQQDCDEPDDVTAELSYQT